MCRLCFLIKHNAVNWNLHCYNKTLKKVSDAGAERMDRFLSQTKSKAVELDNILLLYCCEVRVNIQTVKYALKIKMLIKT